MKNLISLLTYTGLDGKPKLRGFVKVALVALVLVFAVGIVNAVNRKRMMDQVFAAPRPVSEVSIPPTSMPADEPVATEGCPSDSSAWTLTDNPAAPGSNLKFLTPECAYDGLEKTVAWAYATTAFGYTRSEAASMLGLQTPRIAYFPDGLVTVQTDYKDEPQQVSLVMAVDHPDLAEWRVNVGEPGDLSFTFNGCFRPSSVSGGEVVSWGNGYPVVCQFFADYQTEYVVSSINGTTVTSNSVRNIRRITWFGYAGDGSWTWLGTAKEWDVDLSQIPSRGNATLDAVIMANKYGVTAKPLPQEWQSFVGQEYASAFLSILNNGQ